MRKVISIILLIFISNALFSQESNFECDSSEVYFMVQEMPLYFGNDSIFLDNISQQIDTETRSFLKNNNTNITFQITCTGEAIVGSTNSATSQFCKILENELNKFEWIPGKNNSKYVTVKSKLSVRMINDKLNISINHKKIKGELVKCKISDDNSGNPISDVRLITKYNNCSYFSNQNGEVEFYCETKDELEIRHISYQSFSFNAPENTNSFRIKLTSIYYELETVDLIKYSPKKPPYKKSTCNFEDWQENEQGQLGFGSLEDFYAPEMAVFNNSYECLYNYITNKFVLPESAFENEYFDNVDISFTIFEDGTLKNVTFSKQLNYGIDTTLKKLFIEMPKWRPASQARTKTEQKFVIKLIIGINKYWGKRYNY